MLPFHPGLVCLRSSEEEELKRMYTPDISGVVNMHFLLTLLHIFLEILFGRL